MSAPRSHDSGPAHPEIPPAAPAAPYNPDPERTDQDDLAIEERLEREHFDDLGPDDLKPWGGEGW